MYNKTEEDFKKIFITIDKPLPEGIKFRNWTEITNELNSYFEVNLTKSQWKRQYEMAKDRLLKYGKAESIIKPYSDTEVLNNQKSKKDIQSINTDTINKAKDRLKSYLKKPKSMAQLVAQLKLDEITILGIIQLLKIENYMITYNKVSKMYMLEKSLAIVPKEYNHSIGNVTEIEFLVVSDNHWCTKHQQKSFVDYIYKLAHERGITKVYHVGDIVDGYYQNRKEQIYDLIAIGADEQKDYVVKNWPKYPGMKTYLIIGNHDETHIRNGGFNIGKAIARERDDFEYLGIGHAKIWLTPNCRMDLLHPLDGSSYAVSYSGQKYMDSITGGDKPNILFVGHHHKAMYFLYRNIHYFEAPSMTQQSSWMKRKRIANESGAWFIKLKVDEEGTIVSLIPEYIKQYKYLENDY